MAINPADITTVRVDQLALDAITLTSLLPHQVGTDLKQDTVQALVDLVATAIGAGSGVGYLPISVTDGEQLPAVPADPSFFLCGAGTYLNINGFPNVVCTGELNAVMSLPDHWELAVEIPIVAELGVQTVTGSAVDNTDPINPVVNITTQTLQQTMELGRSYNQTVGDYQYLFNFNTDTMELFLQNNDLDLYQLLRFQDEILLTFADFSNGKSTQISLNEVQIAFQCISSVFGINVLSVPLKTSGSGTSTFSIPNNKPAGEYDLLASDGNDLLLQANQNWKIGDYLNDQVSFIEGDVALETIYYRTNNNVFKGVILPSTDNDFDIGSNSFRFKDAYFSGDVKVNGNSVLTENNGVKKIVRIITPSTALTGTTVETQITSFNFTIPANTFSANDILKVETIAWEKSGVANASTCRLKLSNTNNYAGASNVLILAASANNINMRGTRTYKIAGGNLKGFMSASANGIFNDNTLSSVAVSTLALDVTQPIFGFVSLQNSSSADSTIINELIISKW
jgi:hypothetical protein